MLYIKLKHEMRSIKRLESLGVVSTTWRRDVAIFEEFHSWPELSAELRYDLIGEKYRISSASVKKIVIKMGK